MAVFARFPHVQCASGASGVSGETIAARQPDGIAIPSRTDAPPREISLISPCLSGSGERPEIADAPSWEISLISPCLSGSGERPEIADAPPREISLISPCLSGSGAPQTIPETSYPANPRSVRKPPPKLYNVGNGKPPLATRWRPGQSGNPKGRPKTVSLAESFRRIAALQLGNVDGESYQRPAMEILVERVFERAINTVNIDAARLILGMAREYLPEQSADTDLSEESGTAGDATLPQ